MKSIAIIGAGNMGGAVALGLKRFAAGIPSSQLADYLAGTEVLAAYTVIPNLAAEIGESMTFAAPVVGRADDLVQAHGSHPEAEIDRVTTPGGITIRGLNAMEEAGFTASVIAGLNS